MQTYFANAANAHPFLHRSSITHRGRDLFHCKIVLQRTSWVGLKYAHQCQSAHCIYTKNFNMVDIYLSLYRSSRGPSAHRTRWLFHLWSFIQGSSWALQWENTNGLPCSLHMHIQSKFVAPPTFSFVDPTKDTSLKDCFISIVSVREATELAWII